MDFAQGINALSAGSCLRGDSIIAVETVISAKYSHPHCYQLMSLCSTPSAAFLEF